MLHLSLFKIFKKVKTDFLQLIWKCGGKVWRWRNNFSNSNVYKSNYYYFKRFSHHKKKKKKIRHIY